MEKGKFLLGVIVLGLVVSLLGFVLADDLIALQGNVQEGGVDLSSGDLQVVIYDAYSSGNIVYNSSNDFVGNISNGEYDVMLGNGSQKMNLEFNKNYYLELYVNGGIGYEIFSFNGMNRQVFQAGVGSINGTSINPAQINGTHIVENVDLLGNVSIENNLSVSGNISADTGFFNLAWSFLTGVPDLIFSLWGDSNANSLLVSNGTAVGYNESVFNESIVNVINDNGLANSSFDFNQSDLDLVYASVGTTWGDFNSTNFQDAFWLNVTEYNSTLLYEFNQSDLDLVYASANNQWLFNQSDLQYNFNQSDLDLVYASVGTTWGDFNSTNFQDAFNSNITPVLANNFNSTEFQEAFNSNITDSSIRLSELNVTDVFRVGSNTIEATTSGMNITGEVNFDGKWSDGGTTISGGSIWSQILYVYNISSLGVDNLYINGSSIPTFNDTFDFGNDTNNWRSAYFSQDVYISGVGSSKAWLFNQSDLQYNFNQSDLDLVYASVNNQWLFNQSDLQYNFNQSDLDLVYGKINGTDVNWNVSGTDIFPQSLGYSVGIGTTTPRYFTSADIALTIKGTRVGFENVGDTLNTGTAISSWSFMNEQAVHADKRIGAIDVRTGTNISAGSFVFYTRETDGTWNAGLTQDEEGNVGIGNDAPATALDIIGATDQDQMRLGQTTATQYKIGRDTSTGFLTFTGQQAGYVGYTFKNDDGSVDLQILDNGNIGIGTNNPTQLLQVAGNATINDNIRMGTTDGDYQQLRLGGGNSAGFLYGSYNKYADKVNLGYNYYADSAGSDVVNNAGGGTSRLSLGYSNIGLYVGGVNSEPTTLGLAVDSDGDVGIGTISPAYSLEVANSVTALNVSGNLYANSSSVGIGTSNPLGTLQLYNSGNSDGIVFDLQSNNPTIYSTDWGADLEFYTKNASSGTPRYNQLFLEDTGNVGIGTGTPSSALDVDGNIEIGTNWIGLDTYNHISPLTTDTDFFADYAQVFQIFKHTDDRGFEWRTTVAPLMTLNQSGEFIVNNSFYVKDDGNVGIGIDNPERVLHTVGDAILIERSGSTPGIITRRPDVVDDGTQISTWLVEGRDNNSALQYYGSLDVLVANDTDGEEDGDWKFRLARDGTLVDVFRIKGDTGNFGIGTDSPTQALEVNGNIDAEKFLINGVADKGLYNTTNTNVILGYDSGTYIDMRSTTIDYYKLGSWEYSMTNAAFYAYTNNSNTLGLYNKEWKNIYSVDAQISNNLNVLNGRVGIGTDSPASSLHIYENNFDAVTAGITLEQPDGSGDPQVQFLTTGISRWAIGLDNSEGDNFKISRTLSLETDTVLEIEEVEGNIGIGIVPTNLGYKLNIHDTNNYSYGIQSTAVSTDSGNSIAFRGNSDGGSSGNSYGFYGIASGYGGNYGIYGTATGGAINYGVYGKELGDNAYGILGYDSGVANYGGYFNVGGGEYGFYSVGTSIVEGTFTATDYKSGDGNLGITQNAVVMKSGYGLCTLTFEDGLLTASNCPIS